MVNVAFLQGYVVRISGGNDKQGFSMKQGVMTNGRVRLLLSKGHTCYRPRRTGERKRKSVRGCIVDAQLSVLNLVIIKKGDNDIPGLTDTTVPRHLGPKRVGKIRKMFNLSKEDDVRQYVIRRTLPEKEGKKTRTKAPKIQRLVTPVVLQRKRKILALKKMRAQKAKQEYADYTRLLAKRAKEAKEKRHEMLKKKRASSSHRESVSSAKWVLCKFEVIKIIETLLNGVVLFLIALVNITEPFTDQANRLCLWYVVTHKIFFSDWK